MSPARLALLLTAAGTGLLFLVAWLAGAVWIDVLSWTFTLLPVAAWTVAIVLYAAHLRQPNAKNLAERSVVAIRDAVVATIGAALGLNRLVPLSWPNGLALGLLAVSLLLVTAYPVAWLIQWWRGRWD